MKNRDYILRLLIELGSIEKQVMGYVRPALLKAMLLVRKLVLALPDNALTRQLRWRISRTGMIEPLGVYNDEVARALGRALALLEPEARARAAAYMGIEVPSISLRPIPIVLNDTRVLEQSLSAMFSRASVQGVSPFMRQHMREIDRIVEGGIMAQKTSEEIANEVVTKVVRASGPSYFARAGTVFNRMRARAEAIIANSVWAVSHREEQAVWQPITQDGTTRWRWYAVLDPKTCPRCAPLDGEIRDRVEQFPYQPPVHPNCRCVILPVQQQALPQP
jgi:SPP1 gp7 family putative phage head morphogenesis protein